MFDPRLLEESEKSKLLRPSERQYGALPSFAGKRKIYDLKPKRKGVLGLFRYATNGDLFLLVAGFLFSVVNGACLPILSIVFGRMTNLFLLKENEVQLPPGSENPSTRRIQEILEQQTSKYYNYSVPIGRIPDDLAPSDNFKKTMVEFSLFYVYMGIFVLITSFIQTWCWEMSSYRQSFCLRKAFFSQILRQDAAWYDNHKEGDLSSKLSDDIERVQEGIGSKFGLVVQYFSTFFSGIAIGFYANWRLSLLILGACPIIIAVSSFSAVGAAGNAAREQLKYAKAAAILEQSLLSIKTVAAFGGEKHEIKKYESALEEGRIIVMSRYSKLSLGAFAIYFLLYSSYGIGFWYGSFLVSKGDCTPGSVFTVFFSILAGVFTIGNSLPFLNALALAKGVSSKLYDIIERVPTVDPYSSIGKIPVKLDGNISFQAINFNYPSRPDVKILKNINIDIKAGQKVAIVGHSGAGKSTIGQLLLRFYDPTTGQVIIDGLNLKEYNLCWIRSKIGVVTQEPILFGTTIEENIRYGRDGVTKDDIIRAATLSNAHTFIMDLPKGYETDVGDQGSMLSGGQKQRIAIARALVRDPRILLLDEATSALDSQSESIVQQALNNAMKGRTTIIIAHRLSTIKNADLIFYMKEGEVMEVGTHEQLMEKQGLYYKLVIVQAYGFIPPPATKSSVYKEFCRSISKSNCSLDSDSTLSIDESIHNPKIGKLLVDLKRLFNYNLPEWKWIVLLIFASTIVGCIPPIYAFFYSEMFSTFTLTGDKLKAATMFWSLMLISLGLICGSAFALMIFSVSYTVEKLIARLRLIAMENMIRQPVETFDHEHYTPGRIMTKLSHDVPLIKSVSGVRLGHTLTTFVTLVTAITIAFISGYKLASILIVGVPIIIMASTYQYSLVRAKQIRDDDIMHTAGNLASECVRNIKTVQSLGRERNFYEMYINYLNPAYQGDKKQAITFATFYALSQAVIFIMYAAGFRLGTYFIETGEMTPTLVYRVFFALSFCATSVGQSASYLQDFSRARTAMRVVLQLIDKKSSVDPLSPYGVRPIIEGHLELKGVEFSYPSRDDVEVLRGINLEVPPGRTLAIVGSSGSGKSTIINLIQRFYQPTNGFIAIDNTDIRAMNLEYLRSQMGLVTQEPSLFDCSIRENIAYGAIGSVTIQDIIEAATIANIHGFISSLPQGYETRCGERGTQLSGGQKQRIAIARALIRKPKILLLDEATSALDCENEKAVQDALEVARKGRTCIIIAHRLSTIQNADQIAVICQGSVAEIGTHHELMERKQHYYQLVSSQLIK